MSNPELVTPLDLDQWSDSLAAQTTLPILVRRLILATAPVTEITMRAREGALLPGWNGIVRSDVTDPHVHARNLRLGAWHEQGPPRQGSVRHPPADREAAGSRPQDDDVRSGDEPHLAGPR